MTAHAPSGQEAQALFVRATQLDQKYHISELASRANTELAASRQLVESIENYRRTLEVNPHSIGWGEHFAALKTSFAIQRVRRRGVRLTRRLHRHLDHIRATEPHAEFIIRTIQGRLRVKSFMDSLV